VVAKKEEELTDDDGHAVCLQLGMGSAVETLCGQAYGAHKYDMLGVYLQRSTVLLIFFFEGSPEGERIPHLIFHCLCGPRWPDEKGFVTGCSIVLHCLMKNRAPNISKRRVGTGKPACPQPGFSFAVLQ